MSYHQVSGTVHGSEGQPASSKLFLLNRDTGTLIDKTMSDMTTGEYSLRTPTNDPVLVLAVPGTGEQSNARVYDMVIPEFIVLPSVNDIGIPGQLGFGVSVCPAPPENMIPMPGFSDPYSDNFGNYIYLDGSVMVWIPAFWYKWGTGENDLDLNQVDIKPFDAYETESAANADGYAIHRAFYDGGEIQPGFFFDKYPGSVNLEDEVISSHKYGSPASSATTHNPISQLGFTNAYWAYIDAGKTRGEDFFCASRFQYAALAMLSHAHGQASTSTQYCAWYWPDRNWPKGNNNNSARRSDTTDTSLIFYTGAVNFASLAGSAHIFAKTTHNGQNSGVADLNGNLFEVTPGITSNGSSFFVLKKDFAMKDLTSGTTLETDAWGNPAYAAIYDNVGATIGDVTNTNAWRYMRGDVQTFSGEVDSSTNDWNTTGLGIPNLPGTLEATDSNYYSGGIYPHRVNLACARSGGFWMDGLTAGVWCVALNHTRTASDAMAGIRLGRYL